MKHEEKQTGHTTGTTDYALLIRRMRERVLSGQEPERTKAILGQERLWSGFEPEQLLEWSGLALMAGETEVSLQVLEDLTRRRPDFLQVWEERIRLLRDLERREQALAVQAQAVKLHPELQDRFKMPETLEADQEAGSEAIDDPFVKSRKREELLQLYLELFQGRGECFARQWADKKEKKQGYVPVRRPMTQADLEDHLKGRRTYGIYLLQEDSRVSLAVLDADLKKDLLERRLKKEERDLARREKDYLLEQVQSLSLEYQLFCLKEFSGGKGYHFWYFFESPCLAAAARKILQKIASRLSPDLSCFNLEVFPKQDRLAGKGLGNLVKLPLGIHRGTGRRSHFVPRQGRNVWEELEHLRTVQRSSPDRAKALVRESQAGQVLVHPRHQEWANSYPELALLQEKCPALGQVFAAARQGRTFSLREEKVLFGTIGFMTRASVLLQHLCHNQPDYNQHLVEYKLSRIKGTVLGCKKIHALLGLSLEPCQFDLHAGYAHPLLHCPQYHDTAPRSEKVENLQQALDGLRQSLETVQRFLPKA